MSRQVRWTEKDSATLRKLHLEELSLSEIARRMGKPKSTVRHHAKRMELGFDRSRTAAATAAAQHDNAALRAELENKFLRAAIAELDSLSEQERVFAFGGPDGNYRERILDRPTPEQRAAMTKSAAVASQAAGKLAEQNAAQSADAAKSTLARLREALSRTFDDDAD